MDVGCVHGRFQPPHKGHLEYVLAAKARCTFLWIGISRPMPGAGSMCEHAPHRTEAMANPLSYDERIELITAMLKAHGVPATEFACMPFPIDQPKELVRLVPRELTCFVTIYDQWNREKVRLLRDLGYRVEILYERSIDQKIYSGTEIRASLLAADADWRRLVPEEVARILIDMGVPRRLRQLAGIARRGAGEP